MSKFDPAEIASIFELFPLDEAMPDLLPKVSRADVVSGIQSLVVPNELKAALLLYADDIHGAHEIAQSIETSTGSWLHAIVHRREGDFWNSKYWYRGARSHPMYAMLGFDPNEFVDEVEKATGNPDSLVEKQRMEWKTLFDWCLEQAGGVS